MCSFFKIFMYFLPVFSYEIQRYCIFNRGTWRKRLSPLAKISFPLCSTRQGLLTAHPHSKIVSPATMSSRGGRTTAAVYANLHLPMCNNFVLFICRGLYFIITFWYVERVFLMKSKHTQLFLWVMVKRPSLRVIKRCPFWNFSSEFRMNAAIKVACYIYDVQVYSPWLYKYSNYFSSIFKNIIKVI